MRPPGLGRQLWDEQTRLLETGDPRHAKEVLALGRDLMALTPMGSGVREADRRRQFDRRITGYPLPVERRAA